jgi:peptidoglycan/xylan/chitin deacetylase (PgdA/CDA1 family)
MEDKARFVTISVDDGHPTDFRMADLLDELELKATFYIPATDDRLHLPVLSNREVQELSARFEVGSHTYRHVALTEIPWAEARREVLDGKAWLEDVIGRPVAAFSYPRGKFNRRIAQLVEGAGFVGARTCMLNVLDAPRTPFMWGVTTQAYSHSTFVQIRHAALEKNWEGLANLVRVFKFEVDWERHFSRALQHVAQHGGVAHLSLHSWEIELYGAWEKLRRLLSDARHHSALIPVTNGELFGAVPAR